MTTYSRLLLICHPDLHPSPAMARAQALASGTGATLHLVVLSQLPSRLATLDQVLRSNARKQDAEHRKAWLAEQVAALGALGITAYAETVDEDDPLKDLIHLAQLHRVEMVIKDIKHETALSRALLTPLDWQLLRRCPIPLHLVAHAEPTLPTRVIAAVELAENGPTIQKLNDRILQAAHTLAQRCKAQLHLLQAYEPSPSFVAYAAAPVAWTEALVEEMTGRARERLAKLGADQSIRQDHLHLVRGPASKVVSEFANQQGFDVVVMGTLYHEGRTKVVGSTTEQALYKVHSSILAIHG
ncbi:Universal stress protein E homolog [Pseudomonas putida]|uniref:universal stress protein n=1 Tax=Pseudomonas TaxID=286 RepID=UPI001F9B9BE5|nr:Universal stress protein E homolog [Pseudomonas putida]CAB5549127.1 Universal stress protein E homolog [Pseudomonas putida]CAB5599957.1 Universal stress protein E homolog [Pseudomonas putida]CAB5603780.1 Universal stress protein E homolog [Pseudomonas putida]CAB5681055.1 Universal stress protein E homolog [Pseudomonas putida]